MRREHRLDGETADELEDLRRAEALALQRRDRILHAAGLGPLAVLEQILAAAPDAVDPFRQIDALEPGGEGAYHFARQRRRALAYTGRELGARSEEHTSELQSLRHLVCRLLLEKKNDITSYLNLAF